MKTTNEKLVEWVIAKIKKEYKDDICLLVGNVPLKLDQDAEGTFFDYFIPANDKGYGLAKTFIIDGIGYDLYPRSWERITDMTNLDDYNPTCLGCATVLYCRSEEDKKRFLGMQAELQKNLNNREFMFKKALEKLNVAMSIYQTAMFEEKISKVRMAAGFIADYLSVAVAFTNQTYFKYTQINQIDELSVMQDIPENFISYYKAIIDADTIDVLKSLCHSIILTTRKFMKTKNPHVEESAHDSDFHNLAEWYQELSYTWRRIYYWCDQQDAQKAFVWGCMLQQELDTVKEEFGLNEMDLLGYYCSKNLSTFCRRAKELESNIVAEISNHGVKLNTYHSVEEFLEKNP